MFSRSARIFCSLALPVLLLAIAAADERAAMPPEQLIVMRSGEVFRGAISKQGDRFLVVREGTEIRLPARDVDFQCQSLDEAYAIQAQRAAPGRIDDHVQLAQWCLRQDLPGYAGREIAAAMAIDPANPRIATLDRRLQEAVSSTTTGRGADKIDGPAKSATPVSADALDRLVRSLSPGSVELFTNNIQPMLLTQCATAGCHGPGSSSAFTLLRPLDDATSRRLTQRNLYSALEWIDHGKPGESKLLAQARQPHGAHQPATNAGLDAPRYDQLAGWVWQVTLPVRPRRGAATARVPAFPSPGESSSTVLASPTPPPLGPPPGPAATDDGSSMPTPAAIALAQFRKAGANASKKSASNQKPTVPPISPAPSADQVPQPAK